MDRTAPGGTAAPATEPASTPAGPAPETAPGLLDGIPRQRGPVRAAPAPPACPAPPATGVPTRARTGIPFTLAYGAVLAVTSLVERYADPGLVDALHRASSTDVAHLMVTPVTVLFASALWVAGGVLSPYALLFVIVLGALERKAGTLRAAGVFLTGHVLATLATEVPVGLAVLAGQLPDSSLHRLDYGISFGVAAAAGALAGLLTPWPRRALLLFFAGVTGEGLLSYTDPLTSWGHAIALAIGITLWPHLRRPRPAP